MISNCEQVPAHIAIIMDGNGRWARQKNLSREEGHRAGAKVVRAIVTECRKLGVKYLSLYAFSSENWVRPAAEIAALFGLLLDFLRLETAVMLDNGIRLNAIGNIEALPAPQRAALKLSMSKTAHCSDMVLNLALNYGGRAEIVHACQCLARKGIDPDQITEQLLAANLYTAGQPDPDLLIRTSGELRISNFLLYQCAYSEFYFTPTLWPDFNVEELHKAIISYKGRSRRFGGTEAQNAGDDVHGG